MKIIVHNIPDNQFIDHCICFPANLNSNDFEISELVKKNVPDAADYAILDEGAIPQESIFHYSLRFDFEQKEFYFDVSTAKEIWLNHYRTARTPLLASLDVDFMRAVEADDTTLQKEIASKKQALRDVTKTELPDTLEEIKATWPEILGTNPFNK